MLLRVFVPFIQPDIDRDELHICPGHAIYPSANTPWSPCARSPSRRVVAAQSKAKCIPWILDQHARHVPYFGPLPAFPIPIARLFVQLAQRRLPVLISSPVPHPFRVRWAAKSPAQLEVRRQYPRRIFTLVHQTSRELDTRPSHGRAVLLNQDGANGLRRMVQESKNMNGCTG